VYGMRSSINTGAGLATGKYLMKIDAHCCFDYGFDVKLSEDCRPGWTLVPRRYVLDVEAWDRTEKYYEFEYIEKGTLKGRKWPTFADRVWGDSLCDLMTMQGSCWFMHREQFFKFGGLDEKNFGGMGREAQEICLKTWLSDGGRCVLDRNTWYAHWNKPKGHVLKSREEKKKSEEAILKMFTEEQVRQVVKRFEPVPTWNNGEVI